MLSFCYYYLAAGRYDDSSRKFKKALELDPTAPWLHCMLGCTYARQEAYEKAINEHEKMGTEVFPVTAENQFFAAGLGWIYALAGRRSDALKVLTQLQELEKHIFVDAYNFAMIHAGMGDKRPGFRGSRSRILALHPSGVFLKSDPFWNLLRSDPRFTALLRRMGLPQ